MSYEFHPRERVRESVRRCAAEELDRAIEELTDGVRRDPDEALHEARKALKRERSLLRLARATLPAASRRRMNRTLRDAGRRLSSARDADAMLDALTKLADRGAGQVPKTTFDAIRQRFEAERLRARAALERSGAIEAVGEDLRGARLAVGGWRLSQGGWAAVDPGLRRSYARGRRAHARAAAAPTVENLHAFRKRAKDLWYHLRVLEPSAPLGLRGEVKQARALTKVLGHDHDLAVLRERVQDVAGDAAVDLDPLLALIDHRRAELATEADLLGRRVYTEKPRAFARRLHAYWEAGRAEVSAAARARPAIAASARGRARRS